MACPSERWRGTQSHPRPDRTGPDRTAPRGSPSGPLVREPAVVEVPHPVGALDQAGRDQVGGDLISRRGVTSVNLEGELGVDRRHPGTLLRVEVLDLEFQGVELTRFSTLELGEGPSPV